MTKPKTITIYVNDSFYERFKKAMSLRAESADPPLDLSNSSFGFRLLEKGLREEEKTLNREKELKTRQKKE